jgi:hypothetical protein
VRGISVRLEKCKLLVLRGLFYEGNIEMDKPREHGLYIIKDQFFSDFPSEYWSWNKAENRPHFYALYLSGLYWMIPLSSQVEKYKGKIEKIETKRGVGNCIYYHIGLIANVERVFNISDMFPVTEDYILHSYYIGSTPYIVRTNSLIDVIYSKAMTYLNLVRKGQLTNRNDILSIERSLLNRLNNADYVI